jgi:MFS family permease
MSLLDTDGMYTNLEPVGALVSGYLSDIFGRKKSIMIGCLFWIIGSTIICASQNIGMLIAGRVINGFCVGIESAQVPVYISELAPPTKRGRLVAFQQWAITWGEFGSNLIHTARQTSSI